jgi:hypothetical protein
VKRLLILLVVIAGGLAAASFAVPSNAATVNGVAITQSTLNSDIAAIANDGLYACFLNAEQAVATSGQSGLPAIDGVGSNVAGDPHTTASTAFVATYLDTDIGHQLVLQLAAQRHLQVTSADLVTARSELKTQITALMQDVSGSKFSCGATGQVLTGSKVLSAMPSAFVNELVRFDATITLLGNTLAGVGTSPPGLQSYFAAHEPEFDTDCFTVAQYASEADADAALAKVHAGVSFPALAALVQGGGPQGCDILYGIISELPGSNLQNLPIGTVSAPIAAGGSYLLVDITSRAPTTFATAESEVLRAVQEVSSDAARTFIGHEEGRADVWVDPRYGKWVPASDEVALPPAPGTVDLLNRSADSPSTTPSSQPVTPTSGQSG